MTLSIVSFSAVNAGLDKISITFGDQGASSSVDTSTLIEYLDENNIEHYGNADNYGMKIKVRYKFSICSIGIDCERDCARPSKLELNLSRMSDNDIFKLIVLLKKVFGKSVLDDIFNHGNISVVEYFLDQANVEAGDFVPCSKAKKWGVWGKGEHIQSLYWGNKINKSYSKSAWFKSKKFRSQVIDTRRFIYPNFEMNRMEITKRNLSNAKGCIDGSPFQLLESRKLPFSDVEFFDVKSLLRNMHFNEIDAFYLMCHGSSEFLSACKKFRQSTHCLQLEQLIDASRRDGFDESANQVVFDGIERLRLFDPKFDVKGYKEKTPLSVREYHHMGFVTLELLQLLGWDIHTHKNTSLNSDVKQLLEEWYGSCKWVMIAGCPIDKKRAVQLLTLQNS